MKSNEFLLVFRKNHRTDKSQLSPAELQKHLRYWQEWLTGLAVHDQLACQLKRWDTGGKVLKHDNSIIDGPFAEDKESIAGLITVHAFDYQEAKEIALGCPILHLGGTVEIRMAI